LRADAQFCRKLDGCFTFQHPAQEEHDLGRREMALLKNGVGREMRDGVTGATAIDRQLTFRAWCERQMRLPQGPRISDTSNLVDGSVAKSIGCKRLALSKSVRGNSMPHSLAPFHTFWN
jgi:hypothetical protein